MNRASRVVLLVIAAACGLCLAPRVPAAEGLRFELVQDLEPAAIVLAKGEHKGVLTAAKDLQRDITKITGVTPNIVHSLEDCAGKCVVLGSVDCPAGKQLLESVGVSTAALAGKWECFQYQVLNNAGGKEQVLAIAGSNVRGTIFGVYDFEEKQLGVDPLWFWADHEPAPRGALVFDERVNFGPSREPTWKYRGWTLNDHPQLIEWMESGLVQRARYGRYMFAIHPEVFARLWEAALRLKMNMFTWYFIDIDWQPDYERLQAAVDRGLFITQHQMESVGADTGFWDDYWANHHPHGKPEQFSYRQHPEAFREFWSYYIRRWAEFSPQVVWELNLRGWADGVYSEPSLPDGGTQQERAELISQAVADQARLVRKLDPNPDLEMMTTLYSEVGKSYDQGWVKVPENVTTGFGDAGMSGMSYSKKFWTEPRDPRRKYGQYFHTQYFGGGPQIAKCTPVEQYLKVNIDAMHQRGDVQHMLLAMNELRHQQIEIRAVAEMLWDYPRFKPREYLLRYCREEFGAAAAEKVRALYDEYYEKYPHKVIDDGFKKIPSYYKVLEPLFTATGNLLNIESGSRDGFTLSYQYQREIYEQGIRDLGEVLDHARALRESIPAARRQFFDFEFLDAIRLVRGVYKISIATSDALAHLKQGDRRAALAALVEARPLVEELQAGFKNSMAGEKWQYWYRSATNRDFYLLYNLYQKARLRLEVESLSFVTEIEPQRHPYLGNVVMHAPARAGDPVYSSQAERINSSVYNGSPYALLSFPLSDAFQIGGVQTTYGKWKQPVPDYGLAYRFRLEGPATVYVAKLQARKLPWLAEQGFREIETPVEVGYWGWPYRYRERPPQKVETFKLFAKEFPAGEVALGKNAGSGLPYIVFIQPRLLMHENFHGQAVGQTPAGWQIAPHGGRIEVVANSDYEGELRPSVFDLSSVLRYRPLELRSLRLATTRQTPGAPAAEIAFRQPAQADFVVNLRVKPGQSDRQGEIAILAQGGQTALAVVFDKNGRVVCKTSPEKRVEGGTYSAGRRYIIQLRVSPERGTFDMKLEDDQLQASVQKNLALSTKGPLVGVRLTLSGEATDAWFDCDALDAWFTSESMTAATNP